MLSLNIVTAQKNVLLEEATGTWCNNCPSGIYYIDSLHHSYDNVISIAVHANFPSQQDPMVYQEYFEKTDLESAPSANIGRRYVKKNVDEWFTAVQEEMNQQPKAIVDVTTEFEEETRLLTATITVTALENMEGTYTVGGVVVEDAVTGTSALYSQANVYAQLYTQMGGYENMPDPIPYYRIAYDHVARQLLGGYEGEAGFPANIAKDQTYAQTFTYSIPEGYDHNYVRVVGILLNGNGTVDNAGISTYVNGKTNAAPKFTSIPVEDITAEAKYNYSIYVHDTDDRNLTISAEEKPEWLTLTQNNSKSATLTGTPAVAGEYTVVLKVSDGENETIQEYTITVAESLNASWITLGERAFTQVGYGFILGTCSFEGDVYTFLHESGFPALYKYTSDKGWTKLTSIMDEMGYDGSIAAGTDGIYVTYSIKSNNLIKVMKFANNEWTSVGNIGKIGSVPKIAVDAQNSIYITFNDAGENNRYYLNRYRNGNWETLGSYITSGGGSWARLALDSQGIPYVSWVDFFAGNKIYVSKLVGEIWLTVGGNVPVSDENLISKNCQDLAIDANGVIYVAYCVKGTDQLAVYRHNGADWEMLGDNVAGGTVKGIDVAIDSEQNFYVAYADGAFEDKVSVMKYDGTEWSYVGQRGFSESGADTYMAMTLHNDSPCVVYTDIAMGSKATAKYYKLENFLYPPVGVIAKVVSENDIELSWQAPFESAPMKYNVYRNDALIGNTTQTTFFDEDLESGVYNYAVTAVYEDGESSKKEAEVVTLTVSITENNEIAFMIYPNPAKDYVTIESAKDAVVTIYSVSGQMLSQQNISEGINTIDLSELNAGMYFISVNETMVKVVRQ